jgi:membrane protein DedA with SNARE-associated domain/rhodanese-related sulfurtransferase
MVDLLTKYGAELVFANVLLQQLGLPIPVYPTLILAGALAAEGRCSASEIFAVAFIACAISDATWYGAGRLYGRRVMKFLCQISLSPDSCVQQSEYQFHRWGGPILVLAKFVPGLSIVVPSLAGITQLAFRSFALLAGLGEAIWVGVAIGSGMVFHHEIRRLIVHLQDLGAIAISVIGMLLALYIAGKWWRRRRFYNQLRMARISVHELHQLIIAGERPLVVDLRSPLFREQDERFIPGALIADLAEVDQWADQVPRDREVIFYCTCPNEAGSAHVAKQLIDLGYTRVHPLLGGLDAWIAAGYQVERRTIASAAGARLNAVNPASRT